MKEIREDKDIVVISRNVDALVKKLSGEGSIKFINVPGRGIRLWLSRDYQNSVTIFAGRKRNAPQFIAQNITPVK